MYVDTFFVVYILFVPVISTSIHRSMNNSYDIRLFRVISWTLVGRGRERYLSTEMQLVYCTALTDYGLCFYSQIYIYEYYKGTRWLRTSLSFV